MGPRRASAPKHPPNTQLTWQRLQRGWSREELVEQIKRSMKQSDEAEPGLNSDIVRRWETGDRKPEPRYKKHVVLVFGKPASELGLLSAEELALCPAQSAPATTNALMNKQLVDAVVKKVMLVVLDGNAEFGRHLFLKGLLGASLAPLVSNGVALPDSIEVLANVQRTRLHPRSIDAYTAITTSHRDLYWTSSASELLSSVTAHIRLGDGMLKSVSDAEGLLPQRLAAAVAESGVRVFAVPVGGAEGEPIPVLDRSGNLTGYKKDKQGRTVLTRTDVAGLRELTTRGNGLLLQGSGADLGVLQFLPELEKMQKGEFESRLSVQYDDKYIWFAWPAFLMMCAAAALGEGPLLRRRAA